MLVKIRFHGSKADVLPKIEKLERDDCLWIIKKFREKQKDGPLKMNLSEVIRLLTAFNNIEKIYFEVR